MKGRYLITTDGWFIAPDGLEYRAVWGEVKVLQDTFLGVKTNRQSSNWYIKIGSEPNHMIIAGCQINYAAKCEAKPNTKPAKGWNSSAEHGCKEYTHPTQIYIAE